MKIEVLPIDSLKPYENNAKIHTPEQIAQIAASILEFGNNDPIAIDEDNMVIEGHGRLLAARELGMEEVPIVVLDHLTDEQRRAYAIVHNKITMDTGFDPEKILADMDELDFDFEGLGFNAIELADQRSAEDAFVPFENDYEDVDVVATAFVSMPSFIMGTLLLLTFSVKLGIVPANGETVKGLILPIITLALYPMAYITRLTRSSMLDVLGQDYIRTAKAKGVAPVKIIFGHALKNSLIPVITYFGPMLAYIVTGSLVVEQIFAVPGIGRAFVSSITNRDYPMIMGTTIVLACLIVIMNLVSDILYKVVDPRITLE